MDIISPLQVSAFKTDNINHGFFTRHGGVSEGDYESLNLGFGAKDDPLENVIENRKRLCNAMGVELSDLLTVYQVHGNTCISVEDVWQDKYRPQADALVTDKAGLLLGVMTADCGPVLFRGHKENGDPVIGAAHAGWRGAFGGVLQSTINVMVNKGAALSSIHATIGPCIQKKSYEVSTEFYEQFIAQHEENDRFFSAGSREGHPHFDLSGYCAATLAQAGVRNVYIDGTDTYSAETDFFSCRRSAHKGEPDYGRQMSVITIIS